MLTLGEELLLVALDADKGVLRGAATMRIGLNAAGMAELLAAGRIRLRQEDGTPGVAVVGGDGGDGGGEASLDDKPVLAEVIRQARNTREGDRHPERCLTNWASPSLLAYLKALRKLDVLRWDAPRGTTGLYGRIHLLDTDAAASALARIDRVATGSGPSERDVDLAGIVHGLGLDKDLYKGRRNRAKREALATALERQRFAVMVARALPLAHGPQSVLNSGYESTVADMYSAGGTP